MPEHNILTDPYLHEPKGVSTAPSDTAYVANGSGSGTWQPILLGPTFRIENLLTAASVAASQLPAALDTPLQIEFGPAQFGPSDPVQLSGIGTVTINQEGLYRVSIIAHTGRTSGAGVSRIHARGLQNGVQIHPTFTTVLDSAEAIQAIYVSTWLYASAGTTLQYQIMRDSSGANSGGLYRSDVTLAGWQDTPSASLSINRLVNP